jgi:hypothetical protein
MADPGWYGDPADSSVQRWWDGSAWTAHTVATATAASGTLPFEAYLTPHGDRTIVDAGVITHGLAPARCAPHGRAGSPVKVTFRSRTPAWVYLTVFVGIIWPLIIGSIVGKTVVARAWPVCQECKSTLTRARMYAGLALVLWVPLIWLAAQVTDGTTLIGLVPIALAIFVPLLMAVFALSRGSYTPRGAYVSSDGTRVSFPAQAFPESVSSPASVGRSGSARHATR